MTKKIEYDTNEKGCMLVTSHYKSNTGHVQLRRDGKVQWLHRYVYEQEFGEIPEGMVVRHKCDNPSCMNIDHLELGTHVDNVNDRVKRRRSATGTSNGRSKLTEEQARFIKHDNEYSNAELSRMFNINAKVIYEIKRNLKWKHV
jgi:hypothetical protein